MTTDGVQCDGCGFPPVLLGGIGLYDDGGGGFPLADDAFAEEGAVVSKKSGEAFIFFGAGLPFQVPLML